MHETPQSLEQFDDALVGELARMATPGYDWRMFSVEGNAVCSHALAEVLPHIATMSEAHLSATIGAAIRSVVVAGHREVSDTESEIEWERAAGLIAAMRGWSPVSRSTFLDYYASEVDSARRREAQARGAALKRLVAENAEEYESLLHEERARLLS